MAMKKLWRRASGKIKDRNSLLMASITRKSRHRHPDLEAALIRATSHDDSLVDYKNAQRVFTWVRTSPSHLIIFLWAVTRRIERTRDWVVALKSLILLHGVLCTRAPGTRKIGRLPFDLSGFNDGYIHDGPQRGARSTFVRAYFAFSDLKSVTLSAELKDEMAAPMMEDEADGGRVQLVRLQRWQDLLDAVIQVRPWRGAMTDEVVVLEAMDCMVIEVFELYSKICDGIAKALMKIYTDNISKAEASIALNVLQKASRQGEDLSDYFGFCRKIGLLHATECPKIERIPEEDFSELKKIINGTGVLSSAASQDKANFKEGIIKDDNYSKEAMVVVGEKRDIDLQERNKPWLKTVITDKWEVFDEDTSKAGNGGVIMDPFAPSLIFPPASHFNPFIDYGGTPSQLIISCL